MFEWLEYQLPVYEDYKINKAIDISGDFFFIYDEDWNGYIAKIQLH